MPQSPDPLVSLARLRAELRRLREQHAFTQQQVADAMDWSLSKLIRIEGGRNRISTNDLRVLLTHYQVAPEQQDRLLALSKDVRRSAWWDKYSDVLSREYAAYLSYESVASVIRSFEATVMPGLLQTPEYAMCVMENGGLAPARSVRNVELRMQRQQLLEREQPPETHFIVDEAVIRRVVGGPDIMREQLLRLRSLASRPTVKLQILPFSAGLYPRHRRGYAIFEFPDEASLVLYIEESEGSMIIADPMGTEQQLYLETFWSLEETAAGTDAIKMLDDALERLA